MIVSNTRYLCLLSDLLLLLLTWMLIVNDFSHYYFMYVRTCDVFSNVTAMDPVPARHLEVVSSPVSIFIQVDRYERSKY